MKRTQGVSGAGSHDERDFLRQQLAAGSLRQLNLPPHLEADFLASHLQDQLAHIRAHWILIFPLIITAGLLPMVLGLVPRQFYPLMIGEVVALMALCAAVVLTAFSRRWHVHIRMVLAVVATVVLLLVLLAATVIPTGEILHTILVAFVGLVMVAVFALAGLTFRLAAACVVLANALFFGLVLMLGLAIEWQTLLVSAVGGGAMGLIIGVSAEMRDRKAFLQGVALQLEMAVTEAMKRELEQLSRTDALTGLWNRRHFEEALQREWSACRRDGSPLGLIFIDVDHFKNYNDHYGHPAGDACLVQVGHALAAQLARASDTLARYGGEEFVAVLPRTDGDELARIAERVVKAVDALAIRHEASSCGQTVSISIGAAVAVPGADSEPGDLLKRADLALYEAKRAGRHRVVLAGAVASP